MSESLSDVLTVDIADLTIDELEAIEEITGLPFDTAFQPGQKKAKTLKALAFVAKRREDPSFTVEQAGALKIVAKQTETDPTEPSE